MQLHIAYKGTQTLVLASLCPIRSIGLKEDERFQYSKFLHSFQKTVQRKWLHILVFSVSLDRQIFVFSVLPVQCLVQ